MPVFSRQTARRHCLRIELWCQCQSYHSTGGLILWTAGDGHNRPRQELSCTARRGGAVAEEMGTRRRAALIATPRSPSTATASITTAANATEVTGNPADPLIWSYWTTKKYF